MSRSSVSAFLLVAVVAALLLLVRCDNTEPFGLGVIDPFSQGSGPSVPGISSIEAGPLAEESKRVDVEVVTKVWLPNDLAGQSCHVYQRLLLVTRDIRGDGCYDLDPGDDLDLGRGDPGAVVRFDRKFVQEQLVVLRSAGWQFLLDPAKVQWERRADGLHVAAAAENLVRLRKVTFKRTQVGHQGLLRLYNPREGFERIGNAAYKWDFAPGEREIEVTLPEAGYFYWLGHPTGGHGGQIQVAQNGQIITLEQEDSPGSRVVRIEDHMGRMLYGCQVAVKAVPEARVVVHKSSRWLHVPHGVSGDLLLRYPWSSEGVLRMDANGVSVAGLDSRVRISVKDTNGYPVHAFAIEWFDASRFSSDIKKSYGGWHPGGVLEIPVPISQASFRVRPLDFHLSCSSWMQASSGSKDINFVLKPRERNIPVEVLNADGNTVANSVVAWVDTALGTLEGLLIRGDGPRDDNNYLVATSYEKTGSQGVALCQVPNGEYTLCVLPASSSGLAPLYVKNVSVVDGRGRVSVVLKPYSRVDIVAPGLPVGCAWFLTSASGMRYPPSGAVFPDRNGVATVARLAPGVYTACLMIGRAGGDVVWTSGDPLVVHGGSSLQLNYQPRLPIGELVVKNVPPGASNLQLSSQNYRNGFDVDVSGLEPTKSVSILPGKYIVMVRGSQPGGLPVWAFPKILEVDAGASTVADVFVDSSYSWLIENPHGNPLPGFKFWVDTLFGRMSLISDALGRVEDTWQGPVADFQLEDEGGNPLTGRLQPGVRRIVVDR